MIQKFSANKLNLNNLHCHITRLDIKRIFTIASSHHLNKKLHCRFDNSQNKHLRDLGQKPKVDTIEETNFTTGTGITGEYYFFRIYSKEDKTHFEVEIKQKANKKFDTFSKNKDWKSFKMEDRFFKRVAKLVNTNLTQPIKQESKKIKQILKKKKKQQRI